LLNEFGNGEIFQGKNAWLTYDPARCPFSLTSRDTSPGGHTAGVGDVDPGSVSVAAGCVGCGEIDTTLSKFLSTDERWI
jgi:hypothetical protein